MTNDKRRARRLVLIGWDGADSHVLRSLLKEGRLPYLSSLVDSGVALELATPRPKYSVSAWTSLATGKRPHEHGILHAFHRVGEGSELRPVSRYDRKCSVLWDILGRYGLCSHVVGWPVTHPAESNSGICVSDHFTANQMGSSRIQLVGPSVTPPEAARIFIERSMAPQQVEEVTLAQLLPSHAIGSRAYADVEIACREILAHTSTLFRSIRWCLETQRWDFAACVFPGIRRCHDLVNRLRNLSSTTAELCKPLMVGCYEHHDLLLGQLLSQIEKDAYLIVVSPTSNAACVSFEKDSDSVTSIADPIADKSGMAVFCGPKVTRQSGIVPRSLLDIVPTILSLFGIPYGRDMGGRPLTDLFTGGLFTEMIATYDEPSGDESRNMELIESRDATSPGANIDTNTQHLSELGYVDLLDVAANAAANECARTTSLNQVISLMDAELYVRATDILERLSNETPDWFECRSLLAETYYRVGRYHAARDQIDLLTCHGFENPQLYLLSGAIGIAEREFELAWEELSCARRGTAISPKVSLLVGNIHLRKRNFPAAEMAFHQAIESSGCKALALDGMASVKLHLQKFEEAAVFALDALEEDMRLAKAHYHLAVALYLLDKPSESLQALTSWAALEPRAAAPYRWMARVHRTLLRDPWQADSSLQQGKQVIRNRRLLNKQARTEGTSKPISVP